jgi:Cd2+/Zn2+-exporting ATPase
LSDRKKFRIYGLDCPDCALKLEKALKKLKGVEEASLALGTGELSVRYSGDVVPDGIESTVRRLGYDIAETAGRFGRRTSIFSIPDMDCPEEYKPIHAKLSSLPGVYDVIPDYVARTLRVIHDAGKVHTDTICETIERTGFEARFVERGQAPPSSPVRRRKLVMTVVSGIFFGAGLLLWAFGSPAAYSRYSTVLYLAAILSGGAYIARGAFYSARNLSFDMNFLMTVAVIGASAIGEWAEGAATVFLFSIALLLESYSMERATNAIRSLMNLAPETAALVTGEGEKEVPVEDVAIDQTVMVRPGEKVPMDGLVIGGASEVDQSPITGESAPVRKELGSKVFAGTYNRQGVLEIKVTREAGDSTLSRIVSLVEEAQGKRAATQTFIDRFASIYTPVVILLSIATCLIPWLVLDLEFRVWLHRALVILVISCPCALVISTPVTMVCALGQAARNGVLIKGGVHLETLAYLDTVVFDKTGTLTTGEPSISELIPLGDITEEEILGAAFAVEAGSEHHLARAIVAEAGRRGINSAPAMDFEAVPGMGASGMIDGRRWFVGSVRMLEEQGIVSEKSREAVRKIESEGKTAVLVGSEEGSVGVIAVSDTIRPGALRALKRLRTFGVRDMVMLTGDNEGAAKLVASELGIEKYEAGLLPQDKVAVVEALVASSKKVAMVGDGVNDAPALAASNLGVAMGAEGSDTALETADVALMADDLTKLAYAVRTGRRATGIIRQNILMAVSLKIAFLFLASVGFANLWMAVAADMGASLAVIFNGMRVLLLRHLPHHHD